MNKITYILYEFYQEFTEIQGKKDSEIGKSHREFLTALVGKNFTHIKAGFYLEKSQNLSESRARAGRIGAHARYNANGNANGNACVLPLAIDKKRRDKKRIEEIEKSFPTVEVAVEFSKEKNLLAVDPVSWHESRSVSDWTKANGEKVKNWKLDLVNANKFGSFAKKETTSANPSYPIFKPKTTVDYDE